MLPKNRNQPEALIDGRAVILAPGQQYGSPAEPQHPTRTCAARDSFRNHIPVLEIQRRLHRPAGTGILRHLRFSRTAVNEERQVDGNEQAILRGRPLRNRQRYISRRMRWYRWRACHRTELRTHRTRTLHVAFPTPANAGDSAAAAEHTSRTLQRARSAYAQIGGASRAESLDYRKSPPWLRLVASWASRSFAHACPR